MCLEKRYQDVLMGLFEAIRTEGVRVIDLTHGLDHYSPYWPEGRDRSPFTAKVTANFDSRQCYARDLTLSEHSGTHLDSPAHGLLGGPTVDQLPMDGFLSTACVVDVRVQVETDADYRVTVADLERYAEMHGTMPAGCLVFFCTGWANRWPSQERFINQDAHKVKHFPGVSEQVARYLLDRVSPVGIGIDTPSIEGGAAKDLVTHRLIFGAGLYILENVASLELLPPWGAVAVALPLKLTGGSGSPARVLALVPSDRGSDRIESDDDPDGSVRGQK